MKRLTKRLRLTEKAVIFETDGSAWDGCCTDEVRKTIENVHLRWVQTELVKLEGHLMDTTHLEAHIRKCSDAVLAVRYDKMHGETEKPGIFINAVRRTGHRGTSVLNFLTNLTLTIASVVQTKDQAREAVRDCLREDPAWFRASFEGDDGIVALPAKWWTPEARTRCLATWQRAGFIMKTVEHVGATAAEYVGWKFATDDKGLTGECAPDVRRTVAHASWSRAPGVLKAYAENDHRAVAKAAAGTFLCYAALFAGHDSQASKYFRGLAEFHTLHGATLTEDEVRWMGSLEGVMHTIDTQELVEPLRLWKQLHITMDEAARLDIVYAAHNGTTAEVPKCWR
jgi:hypothetical protein